MSTTPGASRQHKFVLLLCLAGAIHAFVFSAAFPVFNQVDEGCHFDLVVRYSHGDLPRGLPPMSRDASLYLLTYASPEFKGLETNFPGGRFPTPSWVATSTNQTAWREAAFARASIDWERVSKLPFWTNYQTSQPPLYYALAALWWHAGQMLGFAGLSLVYWLRFLNVFFVAVLVWIGYRAAREVFSDKKLFTLGVPALIAFAPVQAFYSIQNDILSPVCFGIAFILLMRFWRAETPGVPLCAGLGLALASAYLAKLTNVPLIVAAGIFIVLKLFQLARQGALRPLLPVLLSLVICAAAPVIAWVAWMKTAFGDFTGSAAKLRFITWTPKPFSQWWHHPIFTPHGLWIFVSQLAYSTWQGSEIQWHANVLDQPAVDTVYVMLTLGCLAFALINLATRRTPVTGFQRQALWFSLGCLAAGTAFLAWLSIRYDFGICLDPSAEHPYLAEGRLILGAMIPCLLLYFYGLDYLLRDARKPWIKPLVVVMIILFMLVSEIVTDWTVFASQYNWYHLP
ncbi:MAG TPA: DUF2142 domain-containing protein [Candidatus Acidoferrales bacterium]|nr:DUF2142 domain-containing protein [Candidatus Acidoferrales bacterium]